MANLREFKKALYEVKIIRVPANLCIYNYLDDSNCTTDEERCFVVTGTKGEQWPIKKKDLKKYLELNGNPIDPETWAMGETRTVKTNTNGPHILAYFTDSGETFPAPASWNMADPLVAKPGDAIAYTMLADGKPDENDKYVIERTVFERTYVPIDLTEG